MTDPTNPTIEQLQSECWLYAGFIGGNGYGLTGGELVHRASFRTHYGYMPVLELDHLCRVRSCINPEHLEPVTHAENMMRSRNKFCANGHEWTDETSRWFINRDGVRVRQCRPCGKANARRRYLKKKEKSNA